MTATLTFALLFLQSQGTGALSYDPKLVFGNQITKLPESKLDASQKQALKLFATDCLHKAETNMPAVTEPYWVSRDWQEIGRAYLDLDKKEALAALEKAWKAACSNPENPGNSQASVLQVWLLLDRAKADELAKGMKDGYWRDFIVEREGEWIAPYDPIKGADILSKVQGYLQEIETSEASFELMRDDPVATVKFMKSVKGYDSDQGIINIIGNLHSLRVTENLVQYFDTELGRERCRVMMLEELFESDPERAFATGASVQTPNLRASALSQLAKMFSKRDPKRAALCADEAVKVLKSLTGEGAFYDRANTCADLGFVDTPTVREYLKSLESEFLKHDNGTAGLRGEHAEQLLNTPDLAAAWCNLDPQKSQSLMDEAETLMKKEGRTFNWDRVVSRPLIPYLTAMASSDPAKAAARFKEVKPKLESAMFYYQSIINELLRIDEDSAKAFVANLNNPEETKFLKARLARLEIQQHPEKSAEILAALPSGWERMIWDGDHDNLGRRGETVNLAREWVKASKCDEALKLIEGLPDDDDRGSGYISLAYICRLYAPDYVMTAIQNSLTAYQNETDVATRDENIAQLAGYALDMAKGK